MENKQDSNYDATQEKIDFAFEIDEKGIDEILEDADTFGRYKLAVHLSSYYLFLVVVYHFVLAFFTGDDPSWTCLSNNSSVFCAQHFNRTISRDQDVFSERCHLNRSEWTYTTDKSYSFVTEFDLVCEKTAIAATVSSSYYIGGAVGAVLSGIFSDAFGRRPVIIFSTVLATVSSIGHTYIKKIWQLFALSVLRGVGSSGCFYTTLIYLSEFATPSLRAVSTNILLLFGTASFLAIDFIAYFIQNWKHLSAYTGWALIPISVVFCFLPESPRWLLTSGKINKAETVMDKVCTFKDQPTYDIRLKNQFKADDTKYNYLDLIRDSKILKLTVANISIWFVLPVLYYSIALQSSSLGGNMYQAFALSTVADVPGTLLSSLLSTRFGRKKSILGGLLASGVLLGSMAVVPKSYAHRYIVNISIAFCARFACCISFYGMYTWSLELFPTILRSQGLSVCAISDRLGMFIVPFITRICQQISYSLPFVIMCISAIAAAIIGLWLPETLNQPTRETFEDFFSEPARVKNNKDVISENKTDRHIDDTEQRSAYDNVTLQMYDETV